MLSARPFGTTTWCVLTKFRHAAFRPASSAQHEAAPVLRTLTHCLWSMAVRELAHSVCKWCKSSVLVLLCRAFLLLKAPVKSGQGPCRAITYTQLRSCAASQALFNVHSPVNRAPPTQAHNIRVYRCVCTRCISEWKLNMIFLYFKETQWRDGRHKQELEQETIKGTRRSE